MAKRNMDEDVFVKCPYYKCESQCVIYCRDDEKANCCIHMAFATKPQKKIHKEQFCRSCWVRCLIAEAYNKKWGYKP